MFHETRMVHFSFYVYSRADSRLVFELLYIGGYVVAWLIFECVFGQKDKSTREFAKCSNCSWYVPRTYI